MANGTSARRLLGAGLGLAILGGAMPTSTLAQADVPTEPARPNILIVYTDDVSVNMRRLWCDADRTPTLARFCREGVEFVNAVGSTPLCGPARVALLTGQHGHNNGVTANQGGLDVYDPSTTVATELQAAGYHTLFAGKFVNGISVRTKKELRDIATGWDEFDVIWKRAGTALKHFYDYRMWTRDGVKRQGTRPKDHSTRVVTERLAEHIREAPADQPVMALASLASGHVPNLPLARHDGSAECKRVKRWKGPSYNEADVSDKPAYVQATPRLEQKGFDLRSRCEEMLTVDWATSKLFDALEDSGRLDDTLVIFTSDNGSLIGDHRKPAGKDWPYASPVPMQALWPNGLGDERRVVSEPVSNVDVAATLCELGGCELPSTDGLSFVSLMTGEAETLDRDFVYSEFLHPADEMPPWYSITTSGEYDDATNWVYTEYASGERELYDIRLDPFRLENLAERPEQAERVEELSGLLRDGVVEPDGVTFRAD